MEVLLNLKYLFVVLIPDPSEISFQRCDFLSFVSNISLKNMFLLSEFHNTLVFHSHIIFIFCQRLQKLINLFLEPFPLILQHLNISIHLHIVLLSILKLPLNGIIILLISFNLIALWLNMLFLLIDSLHICLPMFLKIFSLICNDCQLVLKPTYLIWLFLDLFILTLGSLQFLLNLWI